MLNKHCLSDFYRLLSNVSLKLSKSLLAYSTWHRYRPCAATVFMLGFHDWCDGISSINFISLVVTLPCATAIKDATVRRTCTIRNKTYYKYGQIPLFISWLWIYWSAHKAAILVLNVSLQVQPVDFEVKKRVQIVLFDRKDNSINHNSNSTKINIYVLCGAVRPDIQLVSAKIQQLRQKLENSMTRTRTTHRNSRSAKKLFTKMVATGRGPSMQCCQHYLLFPNITTMRINLKHRLIPVAEVSFLVMYFENQILQMQFSEKKERYIIT